MEMNKFRLWNIGNNVYVVLVCVIIDMLCFIYLYIWFCNVFVVEVKEVIGYVFV